MTVLYPNLCCKELCYKGAALYILMLFRFDSTTSQKQSSEPVPR